MGGRAEEQERMKRILGSFVGNGEERRILWMVGTAVYQLHRYFMKSDQK